MFTCCLPTTTSEKSGHQPQEPSAASYALAGEGLSKHPIYKIKPGLKDTQYEQCLHYLAKKNDLIELLPEYDFGRADDIVQKNRNIHKKLHLQATLSGGLAGAATAGSALPIVQSVALPFTTSLSFLANYQGFVHGFYLGNTYAVICDEFQNLKRDCQTFYEAIAIYLLRKYLINVYRIKIAQSLEQAYQVKLHQHESVEENAIRRQAEKIDQNIGRMHCHCPSLLANHLKEDYSHSALAQRVVLFTHDDMMSILRPLYEVTKYILREKKFKLPILINEFETYGTAITSTLFQTATELKIRAVTQRLSGN